jgi:23S rRNA-/tRNA-specific pseudouridylate synthase
MVSALRTLISSSNQKLFCLLLYEEKRTHQTSNITQHHPSYIIHIHHHPSKFNPNSLNIMPSENGKAPTGSSCCKMFALPLILSLSLFNSANGFTQCNACIRLPLPMKQGGPLFGKIPPTAKFDINAIEALEAEIDYQEKLVIQQQKSQNDGPNQDDEWELLQSTSDLHGLKEYEVSEELHNKRIDAILSFMEPDMSRSKCGSLISDGMVAILTSEDKAAGQTPTVTTRKSLKLEKGTVMYVKHAVDETPLEILAQNLPLNILYEDEHMIVLNKAAGMVVHPAVGNWDGTVVNALAYYLANDSPFGSGDFIEVDGKVKPDQAEGVDVDGTDGEVITFRPGIVHRLDKGTTGILVVAKTRDSLSALSGAFANREVRKTYVTVAGK